jgi:hypothetical protein
VFFYLPPLRLEKNVKRELSFSPAAARVAGEPEGLKGGKPASSNEIRPPGNAALRSKIRQMTTSFEMKP